MILPFIFFKYRGEKSDIEMCRLEKCTKETIVYIAVTDCIHADRELDPGDTTKLGTGKILTACWLKPDIDFILEEHVFSGPKGEQRAADFVKRWWTENDPRQTMSEYQGTDEDKSESENKED